MTDTTEPYDPDTILDPATSQAIDLGAAGVAVTGNLVDPGAHPLHVMYAAINQGIRDRGEHWEKCANCGDPYMFTEEWSTSTVCSERCYSQFLASLYE